MPRLTAARRLEIISASIAIAEDQMAVSGESISLSEITARIGESLEDVRESLEPLRWIEFEVPEGIVDLVHAIELDEDMLRVERAWWRRLAVLSPAEAARLYVKAASAASLESPYARHLRTAMAKLRRMVGGVTVVDGEAPEAVTTLRKARDRRETVTVTMEGHDLTLPPSPQGVLVVAVYREERDWMATLHSVSDSGDSSVAEGDTITLPVHRILAIDRVHKVSSSTDLPELIDPAPQLEATIAYPVDREWVLDDLSPRDLVDVADGRRRATIDVWGEPELKTIMLRLGSTSEIVLPTNLANLRERSASEILALYD